MQEFCEKGYVSGLDGLDSSANRNFQIACMKIDWPDSINHLQQSALTSPGLDFCPPSTTLVLLVALCNGFHNTTLNLRSRSPLAHFELLYIYNRQTGRLHIPKGDLDQYVQFLYQTIAHLDSSSLYTT